MFVFLHACSKYRTCSRIPIQEGNIRPLKINRRGRVGEANAEPSHPAHTRKASVRNDKTLSSSVWWVWNFQDRSGCHWNKYLNSLNNKTQCEQISTCTASWQTINTASVCTGTEHTLKLLNDPAATRLRTSCSSYSSFMWSEEGFVLRGIIKLYVHGSESNSPSSLWFSFSMRSSRICWWMAVFQRAR